MIRSFAFQRLLHAVLACLAVFAAGPVAAREWTSEDGRHAIEAEIVDATEETVRLRRTGGDVISVAIADLCRADRAYIAGVRASQASAAARGETAEPDAGAEAPLRVTHPIRCELTPKPTPASARGTPRAYAKPVIVEAQFGDVERMPSRDHFLEAVTKEPTSYPCGDPLLGAVTFGEKSYGFVLAGRATQGGGPPTAYNLLLFDTDGDGDLTNEEVLVGKPVGGDTAMFPTIQIRVTADGAEYDYAFTAAASTTSYVLPPTARPQFAGPADPNSMRPTRYQTVRAAFRAATYCEGTLDIDGKKTPIAILDANSNGRFGDVLPRQARRGAIESAAADRLLFDPARAKASARLPETYPGIALAEICVIDEQAYRVVVSPGERELVFEPIDGVELGEVRGGDGYFSGVFMNDQYGAMEIKGAGKGRAARMPVGEWRLVEGTYAKTPSTYVTVYGDSETAAFTVDAAAPVRLPYGEPFTGSVRAAPGTARAGASVSFSLVIRGAGKERCDEALVDKRLPPEPDLLIQTAERERILLDQFHYG